MADHFSLKAWPVYFTQRQAIARAKEEIFAQGKALPCHVTAVNGAIVTVSFDVDSAPYTLPEIAIPKAESPWIRMPTQVGDRGMTVPCDVYLKGASGQGAGTAKLTRGANFSDLVFVPISSANSAPSTQNAAIVQGPDGAIIQTEDGNTIMTVNSTGVTIQVGTYKVEITSSGLSINGTDFASHKHTGVSTGTSDTGPVA